MFLFCVSWILARMQLLVLEDAGNVMFASVSLKFTFRIEETILYL